MKNNDLLSCQNKHRSSLAASLAGDDLQWNLDGAPVNDAVEGCALEVVGPPLTLPSCAVLWHNPLHRARSSMMHC